MKFLPLLIVVLILSSCSLFSVRSPDLDEGILPAEALIQQLVVGMTQPQVKYLLGSPSIISENGDWYYISRTTDSDEQERITLHWKEDGTLSTIGRN